MEKYKFALTVRDRAIERQNVQPTGYLSIVLLAIFKKFSSSQKMAAILNFQIFAKNRKTEIGFYLLNRAR